MFTSGGLTWNKVPFPTDAAGLGAIVESLKHHVFIAINGTAGHVLAHNGILFSTSDVQIVEADTGALPNMMVWLKAAAPDGSGTIIDVSIELSILLSLVCFKLPPLDTPKKVPAGARCFSRGSEVHLASIPDDGGGIGLVLTIMSSPVGGALESVIPMEVPLLDGLARLGVEPFEWQGAILTTALKSQEWVRAAQIFSAGDATGADDHTAWKANTVVFPFLAALAGEKVVKVGLLIAAAAGFLNCPYAIGEMGAVAMLGPSATAGVSLSVGTKAELEALRPAATSRNELGRARVMTLLETLEGLVSSVAGIHSVEAILMKGREHATPRGINSAFGRGATVRLALNFRMASPRAASAGLPFEASLDSGPVLDDGGQALRDGSDLRGGQPHSGSGDGQPPPPLARADAWAPPAPVAGETIKGISDALLRFFLVAFSGPAELLLAVEALKEVVGIETLAAVGAEGLPFPPAGRPMLMALGLGIGRASALLPECGISEFASSADEGAANFMRFAFEVVGARQAASASSKGLGEGAFVKSTGESGKNAAKATPTWVVSATQGFVIGDGGANAAKVLADLRAKDTSAGWSMHAALVRFLCSSGKPVAEQGAKVDLPKGPVELRSQTHLEVACLTRRGLPAGMHRAIGFEEPDNHSMSAATSSSLKVASSLMEEYVCIRKVIPFLCQSATGNGVVHGAITSDKLIECTRKLAPALDYLVHDILGLPKPEGKSFGICLQEIIEACVGSFTIVLDDLLDLIDNKILREFGERLRSWVLLPQSEARTAPLPDLLGLVEGSLAFTKLEQEAFGLMMKRDLGLGRSGGGGRSGGSGSTGGRGSSSGGSTQGKKAKTGQKTNKRKTAAAAGQPAKKRGNQAAVVVPQQIAPAAAQPAVQGGPGSRHSSSWGNTMTGSQMKELWGAFDAAIASCGPWDKNVPGKPVKPCFHFICLGNGGAGCGGHGGKGGQGACLKRHVVSAGEAAKLKSHSFGAGGQMVLTSQQGAFVDSIVV